MKRYRVLTMVMITALVVVGLSGCSGAVGTLPSNIKVDLNSEQRGIWVSGQGKVTVTPDIAVLSLGISAQAASVADAQAQAATVMDKVMAALAGGGVDKKDIQTRQFSVDQVTRWDDKTQQQVVIGYRVTNMVTAKLRKIDKAGAIIDAVASAGGDLTRINGIGFTVDNPVPYQKEARDKAMADAKSRAEQLAAQGGVRLGKPIYISEGTSYIPTPVPAPIFKEGAISAPETSISPGELEITLNVQVNYDILE